MSGGRKKKSMLTIKARIPQKKNYSPILPLVIPDLAEVKAFANYLHTFGKHWKGEIFGWSAEYNPERRRKPLGSKMAFIPADFWIGESGIWFFSLMWENGKDKEPIEFLDDRGIIKEQ
jgi:hypothetical protein